MLIVRKRFKTTKLEIILVGNDVDTSAGIVVISILKDLGDKALNFAEAYDR